MTTPKNCFNFRFILLALCFLYVLPVASHASSLTLSGPETVVKEGYFSVSLSGSTVSELTRITIEVARDSDFSGTIQEFPALGNFNSVSLTGFEDGTYYLRARARSNNETTHLSNTIQVRIQHYPLWQALTLFFIGLVLFVTLTAVLLLLHRRWTQAQQDNHD